MAELRELADGRDDLLAEVCGIQTGVSEGRLNEPVKRQAADLCLKAGPARRRSLGGSPQASAWCGEVARRRADLDVEVNLATADRVHLQLHGVGGGRPLRRERAVHDGADLGREVSGAHHFRDGLV